MLPAGKHAKQKGYSLVVVMVAVVIMGILAEAAITLESYQVKKSREAELLFRGMAYRDAILSYYHANPVNQPRQYPKSLNDLLSDPRYALRRHIRQLYTDPVEPIDPGPSADRDIHQHWRIFRNEKGGITGIASKNIGKPLQNAFFPVSIAHFADANSYSEWIFEVSHK